MMRSRILVALVVLAALAGPQSGMRAAAQAPQGSDDAAVQAFASSLGSLLFAAGQVVISTRACGGADEEIGLALRRRAMERAQQCAAQDPRLNEVVENMNRAFEFMLANADKAFEARGKDSICARYRAPDLPIDIATALELGRELATEAGRQRISNLPCPATK